MEWNIVETLTTNTSTHGEAKTRCPRTNNTSMKYASKSFGAHHHDEIMVVVTKVTVGHENNTVGHV